MSDAPTGISSSFIPHDVSDQAAPARRLTVEGGGLMDIFVLLAVVLCIASVALAAGVFLYQQYLTTSSQSKVAQLQRARAAFEPSLIAQIMRLDDRMHSAEDILSSHMAPSAFFHVLEQSTLQSVYFRGLQLQGADTQHITLHMDGVARSVNSIALQGDLFAKSSVITSPIFSGIDRQPDGVHFTVNAFVNPAVLRYTSLINGTSQNNATIPATTTAPVQATPASPFGGGAATPAAAPTSSSSNSGAPYPATNQNPTN